MKSLARSVFNALGITRAASDVDQSTGKGIYSPNNPAYPLNGRNLANWSELGSMGGHVTETNAIKYATFLACVKILAESVATLPVHIYQLNPDGSRERTRNHLSKTLGEQANPSMTAVTFKETLQHHLVTWGNAYAYIERDNAGRVKALWPLDPSQTAPLKVEGHPGIKIYQTQLGGETVKLLPDEVLHVPALSYDGMVGYSPIRLFRLTLETGMTAEAFAKTALDNGAWSALAITYPEELEEEAYQQLRKDFRSRQQGVWNAMNPMLLEEGLDIKQIAMPKDDAMFINLRKFEQRELAAIHRIPPHMLADLEGGASYASIEQMSIDFIRYTLKIWLVKWEAEITRKLCVGNTFAEFAADAFMRGETKARYEAYKIGRDGGWLSVNEIREMENMGPIDGGDIYLEPLNMKPAGQEDEPEDEPDVPEENPDVPEEEDENEDDARSMIEGGRTLLVNALGKSLTVERNRIQRIAKRKCTVVEKVEAIDAYYDGRFDTVRENILPYVEHMVSMTGKGTNDEARKIVDRVLDTDFKATKNEVRTLANMDQDPMKAISLNGARPVSVSTRIKELVEELL